MKLLPDRYKPVLEVLEWIGGACVVLLIGFLIALPSLDIPIGSKSSLFEELEECTQQKTSPEGLEYTVNCSPASFYLDVAPDDQHCERVFKTYAAAMEYCRDNNLPMLPSVQLVQGVCKQFDDELCMALERAVQSGSYGENVLGKREAISLLATHLSSLLEHASLKNRPAVREALVHVATAVVLGGGTLQLPDDVASECERGAADFKELRPAESKPIGFWSEADDLASMFRQDRWLSRGLRFTEHASASVVLAAAVHRSPRLSQTFEKMRSFDAKLTNPAVYVDQDILVASQTPVPGIASLADLLEGESLESVLERGSLDEYAARAISRFGRNAGLSLVSYAHSKEYAILLKATGGDPTADLTDTMGTIIEAIESGSITLDPKPDSGWYDYQWHSLETLVLPERGRESAKLELSDGYRERLRNAFATILTKQRESHIKHLPSLSLGGANGGGDPARVEVGPSFCVEPTLSVYLRLARGYRFLGNALPAVLGREALARVGRADCGSTLDDDLREAALRLYGIHELLCVELGVRTIYLDGEMTLVDRDTAVRRARTWLASLDGDEDLARDTRVAAPITRNPVVAQTRYWGTVGVTLQKLEYEFNEKPLIGGHVDAVFVPTAYYAPSDLFVEFVQPGTAPLDRGEYRALCDAHPDQEDLRAALGAEPRPRGGPSTLLTTILVILLAAVAVSLCFRHHEIRTRLRLGRVLTRRNRIIALAAAGTMMLLWVLAMVFSTTYRTTFLIRHVASLNPSVGGALEMRILSAESEGVVRGCIAVLEDDDSQVRYLGARYLCQFFALGDYWREAWGQKPVTLSDAMQADVVRATGDPNWHISADAIRVLGFTRNPAHVDHLLARLESSRHIDAVCVSTLDALARIGDERALDAILPFTRDPRDQVRWHAIVWLGRYDCERAVSTLLTLLGSQNDQDRECATHGIHTMRRELRVERWDARIEERISQLIRGATLSMKQKQDLPSVFYGDDLRLYLKHVEELKNRTDTK